MNTPQDKPPILPVQPILERDLDRVCHFYHTHLNQKLSVNAWKNVFCQPWMANKPNHGFMLVDEEQVVGVIGATYSEQVIRGQTERFSNHHSWVVLAAYRHQSMHLYRALLAQKEFHVTTFTSNPNVTRICQFMQLRLMNDKITVIPNLPWPTALRSRVIVDHQSMTSLLTLDSVRDYQNHRIFPWLGQVALGDSKGYCHVVFKVKKWKQMPAVLLLHTSDHEIFLNHYPALGRYLLWNFGTTTLHIPSRFLPDRPKGSFEILDPQPRMFRSDRLTEKDISYLYSEVVALDMPL